MSSAVRRPTSILLAVVAFGAVLAGGAAAQAPGKSVASIEKRSGVWVEGPGFDVSYGGTYDACAARCLASAQCAMIEYYRPERKCNLYSSLRPLKSGGSSFVGIRGIAAR